MTRQEYLNQKNYKSTGTTAETRTTAETKEFQINSLEDYKKARKALEDYEMVPITLEAADFEAFDRNFEACIEDMTYTETDAHEVNDVDQAISMMRATDWQWATSSVKPYGMRIPNANEFIQCVRDLYEHLLENPHPRMRVVSAGFTINLDIIDHTVSIMWGHIGIDHFDDEFVAK